MDLHAHPIAKFLLIVFGLTLGTSTHVWAWGGTAHKVICEIAFQDTNEKARNKVKELIRDDPDFDLFHDSCTWPDHPRQRANEHFINVPRDFQEFTNDSCLNPNKCLFTAINSDAAILSDSNATDKRKLDALKFLGHWVGDLHQPLHVSFRDDRGGNKIGERGPCRYSLHSVWDTCVVERELGHEVRTIARELLNEVTDEERAEWIQTSLVDWANESFSITVRPSIKYCISTGNECVYQTGNETYDNGEDEKTVTVDQQYIDEHLPIVEERLKQAGIRLAHLLNTSLGQ